MPIGKLQFHSVLEEKLKQSSAFIVGQADDPVDLTLAHIQRFLSCFGMDQHKGMDHWRISLSNRCQILDAWLPVQRGTYEVQQFMNAFQLVKHSFHGVRKRVVCHIHVGERSCPSRGRQASAVEHADQSRSSGIRMIRVPQPADISGSRQLPIDHVVANKKNFWIAVKPGRLVFAMIVQWSETARKSDQLLRCQLLAREDQHNVLQPSRVNILPLYVAQRVAQIYLSDFRPNRMGHLTNFHERLSPGLAASLAAKGPRLGCQADPYAAAEGQRSWPVKPDVHLCSLSGCQPRAVGYLHASSSAAWRPIHIRQPHSATGQSA